MRLRSILSAIFLLFLSTIGLPSCSLSQVPANTARNDAAATTYIQTLLKNQILLTNEANFSKDREMLGASGFLINYNGARYAVTARHLIGEDGGVEPEIKPTELGTSVVKWIMRPRVSSSDQKQTVTLSAKGLDFSGLLNDILMFKVTAGGEDVTALSPNFDLPSRGDALFLIGCPYSERGCKQNSYKMSYVQPIESKNFIACTIESDVELRGFSGAPVVNAKGEVVGVLVSSASQGGKNYVFATSIGEIKRIKILE